MKIIKTDKNQTIFDVAIKYYGTAEAVGKILNDNKNLKNDSKAMAFLNISDTDFYIDLALKEGQNIIIDTSSELIRKDVVRELEQKNITFYGN